MDSFFFYFGVNSPFKCNMCIVSMFVWLMSETASRAVVTQQSCVSWLETKPVGWSRCCWMEQHMWLTTVNLMEVSGAAPHDLNLRPCDGSHRVTHTHTLSLVESLAIWVALVTTQVEVVSMAMTDSHPTWGQSPPLELDCTTRPHRRGELLCLPSPDRPIRAARNWEVLGPTAGWGGVTKEKHPDRPLNNPQYTHTPTAHHKTCMHCGAKESVVL